MNNPYLVKLKKTGFLEKHLETEKLNVNELENKQYELRITAVKNATKLEEYKNRKPSFTVINKNQ